MKIISEYIFKSREEKTKDREILGIADMPYRRVLFEYIIENKGYCSELMWRWLWRYRFGIWKLAEKAHKDLKYIIMMSF